MDYVEPRHKLEDVTKLIGRIGIGLLSIAASVAMLLFNETRQDVKQLLINQARFEQLIINADHDLSRHDKEIEKMKDKIENLNLK